MTEMGRLETIEPLFWPILITGGDYPLHFIPAERLEPGFIIGLRSQQDARVLSYQGVELDCIYGRNSDLSA